MQVQETALELSIAEQELEKLKRDIQQKKEKI